MFYYKVFYLGMAFLTFLNSAWTIHVDAAKHLNKMKYAKKKCTHHRVCLPLWKWIVSKKEKHAKIFNGCFVCEIAWEIIMHDGKLFANDDRKNVNAFWMWVCPPSRLWMYLIIIVLKCNNTRPFEPRRCKHTFAEMVVFESDWYLISFRKSLITKKD